MTGSDSGWRSSHSTLMELQQVGTLPWGRLALSTGLGTAAALSTVALMACSGALIDKAALRVPLYTLTLLMAAVQIFALSRGPLRYGERVVSHDAALRVLGRLRVWFFDAVEPLCPAGLRQLRSGDLLARATADIETLQDLYLRGISPLVVAAVTSFSAVSLVTIILPAAGLLLGGCLIAALILTSCIAWERHHRLGSQEAEQRGELSADIVELLQGAADLIAFGQDEEYLERILAADEALTSLARRRSWTAGAITALSMGLTGIAVCAELLVAIPAAGTHRLPAYLLAVLPLVALASFEVVVPVADAVSRLAVHLAAADRLLSLADLPAPVEDPIHPAPLPGRSDIEVADVRLRYDPDSAWALDGFTMSIPGGSRVALVGASGSGKSSLVNVLLRFWGTQGGEVKLGGTPLDHLAQETSRSMTGWVAQDTHLFNTTVRANIAVARPEATDDDIATAARTAQLGVWIDSLPEGLDTAVGEMGLQLSGGQRQRLALARALLADPAVLILDEPTSGLDRATASRLLHDVLAAMSDKSVLYVTHRQEEVALFDDIVVLRDGRAVAAGTAARGITPQGGELRANP